MCVWNTPVIFKKESIVFKDLKRFYKAKATKITMKYHNRDILKNQWNKTKPGNTFSIINFLFWCKHGVSDQRGHDNYYLRNCLDASSDSIGKNYISFFQILNQNGVSCGLKIEIELIYS